MNRILALARLSDRGRHGAGWSGCDRIAALRARYGGAVARQCIRADHLLQTAIGMIKDLLRGRWGVDVLAVMALSTVAVGEYLAALVIVLMLSGGRALEDYAAGRAKQELTALLEGAPRVAHLIQADTDDISMFRSRRYGRVIGCWSGRPRWCRSMASCSPEASLDESSLTGESLPVARRAGNALSGSLNGGAPL